MAMAAAEAAYHEAARTEAHLQGHWFAGLSRANWVQIGDGAGVWAAEQLPLQQAAMARRREERRAHEAKQAELAATFKTKLPTGAANTRSVLLQETAAGGGEPSEAPL